MADLIDRLAVIDRYYAEWEAQNICDGDEDRDWLKRCVEEAPTVDAVEVVRCLTCIHFAKGEACLGWCSLLDVTKDECGYCEEGERRAADG